jgi:hypothetical protein
MAPHSAAQASDQYGEEQAGAYAYQGESKPFEFTHLPVGDYVLVFNRRDQPDPGWSIASDVLSQCTRSQ